MSKSVLKLNAAQHQAVTAPFGVQLVLAGAGSGKTQVLVQRIGFLVNKLKCNPSQILAVTFTNKAAGEMKERITTLLNNNIGQMWVGTFHGFAHRLLRRHYLDASLPHNFQILDTSDQRRLIKEVLQELNLTEKDFPIRMVAGFINQHKDDGIRPDNIQTYKQQSHQQQYQQIYVAYEKACMRSGVIDFAELLLRTLELLRGNANLLHFYQQRFQHILVDEFQDTNSVQYAWLRLLADKCQSLMVVGDDDQSIYGWRGAKIENIQNFHHDFRGCVTVRLEQNYRSTGVILDAANAVIVHNGSSRLGKQLWTAENKGEKINLYGVQDGTIEAQKVALEIINNQEHNHKLNDIAILYRANAQSRALEEELKKQRIAYRIYGDLSFYERAEIKNAMAYLTVINNPDHNPALGRIINFPPRAIGKKTIELISQIAHEHEISLWQALAQILEDKILPSRAHTAALGFRKKIIKLQDLITLNPHHLNLADAIKRMLEKDYSGLIAHYEEKKDDKPTERVDNLKELITAAGNFVEYAHEMSLADQLQNFIDQNALFIEDDYNENATDYVHLMTVHRAKGLEFKHVIITGLEEEIFPLPYFGDYKKLEEERRLFYVALTRAKLKLSLYYAEKRQMYGKTTSTGKSSFIDEIPKYLLTVRSDAKKNKAPKVDHGFSLHKTNYKMRDYFAKKKDKYRLGQEIFHQELGDCMIIKIDGNKIALFSKIDKQNLWIEKDDPLLTII